MWHDYFECVNGQFLVRHPACIPGVIFAAYTYLCSCGMVSRDVR